MTQRDRIVVMVVLSALAIGGFFMLVLKPKRDEAVKLSTKVSEVQKRVETARLDLATGQQARSTYAANYATVARLGKAVPTDDDIPSLVFQLDSTAESTGVDFRSVKLTSGSGSAPTAPQNAASAAAATADQGDKDKAGEGEKTDPAAAESSAAGTPASPVAPTQSATAALPPGAIVGDAGLSTMPFSFSFEGDFFRLSKFLTRIERYIKPSGNNVDVRGRLLLVDGIALRAAQNGFPEMQASIAATAPPRRARRPPARPRRPPAGPAAAPRPPRRR